MPHGSPGAKRRNTLIHRTARVRGTYIREDKLFVVRFHYTAFLFAVRRICIALWTYLGRALALSLAPSELLLCRVTLVCLYGGEKVSRQSIWDGACPLSKVKRVLCLR